MHERHLAVVAVFPAEKLFVHLPAGLAAGVAGSPFMDIVAKTIPPDRRGGFFGNRDLAGAICAIVGGYVITPRMVRELERTFKKLGSRDNDALRLIAGFQTELKNKRPVHGFEFKGRRLDCGTLEGFYEAEKVLSGKK